MRSMKHTMRRTAGISWEQWHHMVVMQSLKMMVMSGVVRRADLDPPLVHFDSMNGRPEGQGGDQTSVGSKAGPGWFSRMFFRREHLLRYHH
jgi:hypothetical protein